MSRAFTPRFPLLFSVIAGLLSTLLSGTVFAATSEREVARLDVGGNIVTLQRGKVGDGGLRLRLMVADKAKHKKLQSVLLYEGGGDDDGAGDKDWKSVALDKLELPDGSHGVRVDFEYTVPGDKRRRQIDSYFVAIDDSARKLLEVTTHRERNASRICHETEQTSVAIGKDGKLVVRPLSTLESDLDDEDSPIDPACEGKHATQPITYKYDGEAFVQIDPPLPRAPKQARKQADEEEENDD